MVSGKSGTGIWAVIAFIHSFFFYIFDYLFIYFWNLFNISRQLLLFFPQESYRGQVHLIWYYSSIELLSALPCAWAFGWVLHLMLYYNMKNVKIDCSQWGHRKLMVNPKFAPMSLQSNLLNTGTEGPIASVVLNGLNLEKMLELSSPQGLRKLPLITRCLY